jgi:penicillin-binding protein 2
VIPIKPEHLAAVRDGLWLAVNGAGTAASARIQGRDVAGKTGTAQVISLEGARVAAGKIDVRDHAWFVFIAPKDNPRIAGLVLVEHGGHGGASATPIARHVIDTYFAKREGRPLPAMPAAAVAAPADAARTPVAPGGRGRGPDGGRGFSPGGGAR